MDTEAGIYLPILNKSTAILENVFFMFSLNNVVSWFHCVTILNEDSFDKRIMYYVFHEMLEDIRNDTG